jgi:hypothetical protein
MVILWFVSEQVIDLRLDRFFVSESFNFKCVTPLIKNSGNSEGFAINQFK